MHRKLISAMSISLPLTDHVRGNAGDERDELTRALDADAEVPVDVVPRG